MKKRPILLLMVCVVTGLVALLTLNAQFRQSAIIMGLVIYSDIIKPNDPVTRTIRNGSNEWGAATELTPKPFKKGDAEDDVLRQLSKAKYTADTDKSFSWRKPRSFPAGSQFYERYVEGLPCSVHFEVVVRFDDQHRLIEAWGTEDEAGCL
ncbi:hypothetical protein [Asticcacaulis taihuensis]|jgi:hypothetical protein|uniref:hypothetical protein n=1 Tax=Asticcacaulis taihuensis TaxID=260084 RepID=UPI0026EBFD72|nr:hypothetical protein [Asticcacaulis taihuensis]